MGTFTNSEDSDEMPHTNSEYPSGSTLFVKVKKIFRQKKQYYLKKYTLTPLDHTLDHPKLMVLNQKEEFISIQRVDGDILVCNRPVF